jgi:hypothetical protein
MFLSREPFLKKEYNIGEGNRVRDNMQGCSAFLANIAANRSTDNRAKYIQEVQEWPL